MKNLKYVFSIVLLTFIIGCGYTPMKTSENINFYIIELNIQGDRQINNIILSKLKKYQKPDENKKHVWPKLKQKLTKKSAICNHIRKKEERKGRKKKKKEE